MIPKNMRQKYNTYISSPRWKDIREKVIRSTYQEVPNHDADRGHFHCEKCQWNFQKDELKVHHLNYDRLGNEKRSDLAAVCTKCRKELYEIRAKKGRDKSNEALEDARFEGFAIKKYDEDWRDYYDPSEVYEEFLDWLDSKEDW